MPLFLFLAGVFFSPSPKPKEYLLKKSDALLKPYFVTLFFLLFISILLKEDGILMQAGGIIYGNGHTIRWMPLWFLTHLWSLFVTSYLLFHYTKLDSQHVLVKLGIVFSMILAGSYLVNKFGLFSVHIMGTNIVWEGLPFNIDIIFLSMAYFASGYFLNRQVKEFTPRVPLLIAATLIFFSIVTCFDAIVDFNLRVYHQPVFSTIAAIAGIYLVLAASQYLKNSKILSSAITTIGSASLFVLIFHSFIGGITSEFIIHSLKVNSTSCCAATSFIASVTLPLLIRKIILKSEILKLFYFPLKDSRLLHPPNCGNQ